MNTKSTMKKQPQPLSYTTAYAELQQIVSEIQEETINLDDLTAKIARATELISFCRDRLRMTEEEVAKLTDVGYLK